MRVDDGVACLVWRKVEDNIEYLILKRDKNWTGWELPKGHMEYGNHYATLLVELDEETGIRPTEVKEVFDLERYVTWSFEENGKEIISNFKAFSVEVDEDVEPTTELNPSDEHEDIKFVSKTEALELLEYPEQRELLEEESQEFLQGD